MSGILSKNAKISYKTAGSSYTNLPDCQSISAIGSDIETVDVTTLADSSHKNIKGLDDFGNITCTFLYSKSVLTTIKGLTGDVDFQIELPDQTTFSFTGQVGWKVNELSVGEAITMEMSIAISSDIVVA